VNRLCKRMSIFAIIFSLLSCLPIYSEWSSYSHVTISPFTHKEQKKDYADNRVRNDFSYDVAWADSRGYRSPGTYNFEAYTTQDFKHHCARAGYTQEEILNQRCLYMFEGFVKYAQTYPGYQSTIRKLYAELKSLSVLQKAYYEAKGTYCRGLQDRIAYLYKEVSFVFSEQFAEYAKLESIYDAYVPSLAKAINVRSQVYKNGICGNYVRKRAKKSYNLNNNVKQLLSKYGHETKHFMYCFGNQLQQVIHQESLDILDRVNSLPKGSLLYPHRQAMVDFTVAMADYNHAHMTDKAMDIGDLCWTLLDYGQAIAEGVALGVYSVAHDVLTHPIETTVCIVASKEVLAYQLCKVLYNVADIGVTAIHNVDEAKEKWNKYTEPLNNIIDAITNKEITVRDAIKNGTAFVVGYKAQGRLLGGLGKFCNTIKQKSINFVKNNSLLNPQEYLITPEGLLFKATTQSNKLKLAGQTNSATNLKNTVNSRVSKNIKNDKPIAKIATNRSMPINTLAGKGIIRNIKNLKSNILKHEGHIFSDDHLKKGILALGKSKATIMDSLYDAILSVDKKGLLQEGPNQLRVMINGIDNVEVRCCIRGGEVISVNAFISDFGRIFSNFVDITKV